MIEITQEDGLYSVSCVETGWSVQDAVDRIAHDYESSVKSELKGQGYQLVKLPTARDGKQLALGDVVYEEDGKRWVIDGIGHDYVWGRGDAPTHKRLKPLWLTHEPPDSWESIARDAVTNVPGRYLAEHGIDHDGAEPAAKMQADLVARMQKLAKGAR